MMPYRAIKHGAGYAIIGTVACAALFSVAIVGQTNPPSAVATDTFLGLTSREGILAALATILIMFCMSQLSKWQSWARTDWIEAMDRNTAALIKNASASDAVKDAVRAAPCGKQVDSDRLTGTSAVERVERREQRTEKETT